MTVRALPHVVLVGFLFGSGMVATRLGLRVFSAMTFNWLVLTLASIAYIGTLAVLKRWPRGKDIWRHASIWGILGAALPMSLFAKSLHYQSSGLAAMMIALAPGLTCIMAYYVLPEERLTAAKISGVILALLGALVLAANGETGLSNPPEGSGAGLALSFLGVLFGSSSDVYARRFMQDFDLLGSASIRTFAATAVLTPVVIFGSSSNFEAVVTPSHLALVYTALAVIFAGTLMTFNIIRRFGATIMAMAGFIIPLAALLLGVLMLNETVTPVMALGILVIFSGLFLVVRKPR